MNTGVLARFRDTVCMVTGAGQGIGLATARRLAAEGATLVLIDLAADSVRAAAAELPDAAAYPADAADHVAVDAVVSDVLGRHGRIDVLVNNVGGTRHIKPFALYTVSEMRGELERSLWTAMVCCHAVLPHMLERGQGSIVNVGSNSPRGIYRAPYAAAKGGVFALTTSLAAEVARAGVRVNCVAPGATTVSDRNVPRMTADEAADERQWIDEFNALQEKIIPMGRWGTVDEQSAAIAFMASPDASFITGQILSVGGGLTVP